ncbi:adenylyl-sulfate kinase [Desulfolutivibrio sulfodismutans]|nr:adenylyl-sulfate kinase [Desulfolutivibrio sulfodismutans]
MTTNKTLIATPRRIALLRGQAVDMPSVFLDEQGLRDLELLLDRGYFPLCGYATRREYESILDDGRLPDGTVWPIPITLPLSGELAQGLSPGDAVSLRDPEGFMLAVLRVAETWRPDLRREALAVYGTDDPSRHPGVERLFRRQGTWYAAGGVEGLAYPQHYDFRALRRTPAQTRELFARRGWRRVLGYQEATPLHRMHREMLLTAAAEQGARLFISPLTPPSLFTEVGSFPTVRCYEHFVRHMPRDVALLGLTPLYSRGAGPRGALLQAIVNRNYGCTHFLVHEGHDDPFPGDALFYPPWAALEALQALQAMDAPDPKDAGRGRLDIVPVAVRPRRYVPAFSLYLEPREIKEDIASEAVSHADLTARLGRGEDIPEWYTFPEVLRELLRTHPSPARLGFTLFLTGLSGAGKSTLAKVLSIRLLECQDRPVSLLDGDIVRRHLSSELTFSKEHRNLNVQRIGYVASEITKNRGIALCAPIAPYPESRRQAREMVSRFGPFIEIHISTPLSVCEQRDRKGLYAKARAGIIHGVTGVDDPYLPPENPELRIDTTQGTPLEAAEIVLAYLKTRGLIGK